MFLKTRKGFNRELKIELIAQKVTVICFSLLDLMDSVYIPSDDNIIKSKEKLYDLTEKLSNIISTMPYYRKGEVLNEYSIFLDGLLKEQYGDNIFSKTHSLIELLMVVLTEKTDIGKTMRKRSNLIDPYVDYLKFCGSEYNNSRNIIIKSKLEKHIKSNNKTSINEYIKGH